MKIARYKRVGDYEYETVNEVSDYYEEGTDWVRISYSNEVEFTPLPPEDTVNKEITCLEAAKDELATRYYQAKFELDEKIAKLLAIEDHSNV
jgi:hypothetical protein